MSIIKQAIITAGVAFSFLLVGCQNSGPSEGTSNSTNDNSEKGVPSGSQDSTLPLEETEYGRGAESDGEDTNAQEEPTRIISDDANSIIIYFSRSGNTQNLARMIYNEAGGDMLELTVANPYPSDYEQAVERADNERDNQEYPEINTDIPDLSQYDTVYLGYQTWSMTLSNPMISFLMDHGSNFSGKTIYPFSTNAGYGEGDTIERIKELTPDASVATSFSIQDEELLDNQDKVNTWLNDN
ncbi:flavodoxin [Gracilibacillus massiliensis]|uniref:flavodoxin n=1 Tax=Gracilibacillus massiliensis TaxID=1564956 RepID=UPI000A57A41C|nr:flavodoxin [Gracilibacillus massiliensis]